MAYNDSWNWLDADLAQGIPLDPCKRRYLVSYKTNGFDILLIDRLVCSLNVRSTDAEVARIPIIELTRILTNGGFAFHLNGVDNPSHGLDYFILPVARRPSWAFYPADIDRRREHYLSHTPQIPAGDPLHPIRPGGSRTTPKPLFT